MANLDEILWDIRPHHGCGPLNFGMTPLEVAMILGKPDPAEEFGELRPNCPWRECFYEGGKLEGITANFSEMNNLYLGDVNLMNFSVLSVIEFLGRQNGVIEQAQGGSLYFDAIGAAFIQFDAPQIREIWLYPSGFDHGEPLIELSLLEVQEYYISGVGGDPSKDPIKQ